MKSPRISVGIIGWSEGAAGLIDSWLPEIGFQVDCFISTDSKYLSVDRTYHQRFGNKKFAYPTVNSFKERPLFEDPTWYLNSARYKVDKFIVALDDSRERVKHINQALLNGVPLISAIHPSVIVLNDSSIGQNCIIQAGAVIGYKVSLGKGVVINTGVQLDHHVVVEDGVTIDPGCVVAGNVLIQEFASLHLQTSVINKIIIGKDSITGAGSVVIRDVEPNSTIVGNPARRIK